MPKKIDKEKEDKFIEFYCEGETAGNATQSCIKAGWSDSSKPRQMGAYLKKKYSENIRKKQEERISSAAGSAISVLQDLLLSEQDAVKLNTARLILELGNFSSQTINLNVDKTADKTDGELVAELQKLIASNPDLQPKLKVFKEDDVAPDLSDGVPVIEENTKH